MVERRRQQRMLWEGWFPEEAAGWWEPWMKHADQVLDDAELLDAVYEAQGQRRPNSRRRGRKQTSSEATLRLAVLKHVRNWSFEETEREVRANHQRVVGVAQEKKVVQGRKLRVDTTVIEANVHYPTDSSLLEDGARVLSRTMKKIVEVTKKAGTGLRDRMRSIGHRAMEIARTSRSKGPQIQEKMKKGYRKLLRT